MVSRKIVPAATFWSSQTLRLTMFYLAIIMAMSLSYSTAIYFASSAQLSDEAKVDVFIDEEGNSSLVPRVQQYLDQRASLVQHQMFIRLVFLNSMMLLFGSAISFLLARRTLEPIEKNVAAQARFVSDASHELKTPLAAIRLDNEVALRNKKLKLAEAKQVLRDNLDEVDRLHRMSGALLKLADDNMSLDIYKVPLSEIIDKATEVVRPMSLDKKITIKDSTAKAELMVDGDAIVSAVTAILDNAIKYSPPKSTIEIKSLKKRQAIILSISDQGPGLSTEDQSRIFDRFYRADSARTRVHKGGYGLGLSIVDKIMQAHGSEVQVSSSSEKGSTFRLTLPRS